VRLPPFPPLSKLEPSGKHKVEDKRATFKGEEKKFTSSLHRLERHPLAYGDELPLEAAKDEGTEDFNLLHLLFLQPLLENLLYMLQVWQFRHPAP